MLSRTGKSTILTYLFTFVYYYKVWSSSRGYVICLDVKIPEEFVCVILQDWWYVVHILSAHMVKFRILAQFPGITLPTQSCLVLYSFCASLLHLLIMWLIVLSLLPHNYHLLLSFLVSSSGESERESMSPKASMTLLSILAYRNNAVVWIVSIRLPTLPELFQYF